MTEKEDNYDSSPDIINVKVLCGRNFKGPKGEFLGAVTIKAQFGEKTLGDVQKIDCTNVVDIDIRFSAGISCSSDEPASLDEIAYKPVVLTFAKILPKEKKKKEEEKTITLGQCTIDLLPIIKGERSFEITQEVLPVPGSLWEALGSDHAKPEIDITVNISNPLQDRPELTDFNILTITVESLVSPPECLTLPNHIYVAALSVPLTNEKENLAVFSGAHPKCGSDKEPANRQKKWANPGVAQGGGVFIPDCWITDCSPEDEYGDFRSKEDREYMKHSEQEKSRYIWNIERRCFLHPSAVKSFQTLIAKRKYCPIEVFRVHLPSGVKGKKGNQEDDGALSYHGIAYVDASPLLYPGVQTIRGAYKVNPFSETALQEKTGCSIGLSDDAAKAAINIYNQMGACPSLRKGKEERKEVKKKLDVVTSEMELNVVNTEGQLYVENKTYIWLEMTLKQPLIPKRTLKELTESVAACIPPRPLFPKRVGGADRAVSDFHKQVECVSKMVLEDFRQQFNEELSSECEPNPTVVEERKRSLLYELNNSGKYFTYKERLKHAVVKIVREKYLRTSNFEDKQELQNFLSQLYIFLMDEMHVALNKFLSLDEKQPIPEPVPDSTQLKHFAIEAEMNGNICLAAKYHEERIARDKNDASHWLDYAIFCLSQQDMSKAEECLRKCVAIDQENFNGILLFAIISCLKNQTEIAETFLEKILMIAPKSIIAWTVFGLFQDSLNNEIRAEMAFSKASQLNIVKETTETDIVQPSTTTSQPTGDSLTNVQRISDSIAEIPGKQETSVDASEIGFIKPEPSEMHADIQEESRVAGTLPNHKRKPSEICNRMPTMMEDRLSDQTTTSAEKSIFMITIEWLLQMKAVVYAERALSHELLLTQNQPSLQYFISLAQINILNKDFLKAAKILEEALQISYDYPDTWALLGHVKYFMGDVEGAQSCYERTLDFVNDATDMHPVYLRLASIYLQDKKFEDARKIFLMACQSNPSSVSWLGVGISCYRMGKIFEAEASLCEANILNNMDPEVWAYLSLVSLKKERKYEAEQSYKYALKLGFQDEEILRELMTLQNELGFGDPSFPMNHGSS